MGKTKYTILRRNEDGSWDELLGEGDFIEAASPKGAIRAVDVPSWTADPHTTFVAIPLRSWKPTSVAIETKQVVKIG